MPVVPAIAVALLIASVKASLVALFFMHLKGEVRSIVWTLLLTAIFFIAVMTIPVSWYLDGPKHAEGSGPTARSLTTHEAH
jgi:heme/copper-type cytochrome/quinol oxidase subunit 4